MQKKEEKKWLFSNRKRYMQVRFLCQVLYSTIGKHLPSLRNSHRDWSARVRFVLAKGYLNYCGKCVNIQPKAIIAKRVSIGDYSGVGAHSIIQGGVFIGNHVMIGPWVYIYTQNHNHSRTDVEMDKQGFAEEREVIIGNDVWIGSRVTILPGVTIGDGCVIGASAVVTKSLPPYSIAVGAPAVVKKYRKTY